MIRFQRVATATLAAALLSACGGPSVEPIGVDEDGIAYSNVDPETLRTFELADGEASRAFETDAIVFANAFDRAGVLWESIDAGGTTRIEVEPDGSGVWHTVEVDFQEYVPETHRTLYAGHVDVPAGSQTLRGRVILARAVDAFGDSPSVEDLQITTFNYDQVAEEGEPYEEGLDPDDLPADFGGFGEGDVNEDVFSNHLSAPPIVSRSTWGARAPRCSGSVHNPYRLTYHHTVTPNGEKGASARARMRQIQVFHQNSNGWCDIGYHFTVDAVGTIYRARTTSARTGAHVGNQNTGNVGVALLGTYTSVNPPEAQLGGLVRIFSFMAVKWSVPRTGTAIRGHTEWPGQSTSCPGGKALAKKSNIITRVRNYIATH